jgi:hypothetical protein
VGLHHFKEQWIMRKALVSLCSLFALMGQVADAGAVASDAVSALGFENPADWTIQNGTIVGSTATRTQGLAALAVHASGYTVLRSRLIGPLGQVAPTLKFDLKLPNVPPQTWAGATQLFVSIPSLGLNNAYVGQVELTGLASGAYHPISFPVPDAILTKMRETYSDLSFAIVLNVPANAAEQYLLDNLEVSATIPPNSTVGMLDRLSILGFERTGWTMTSGTVLGLSTKISTEGTFSLAVNPQNYSTLTSPPLPSIGPVGAKFSFDLWQPQVSPPPTNYGAAQLFVSIPSQNVYSAYLGQVDLNALPRSAFSKIEFNVPTQLLPALDAQYTDLTFAIALNVPPNATGPYYVDNFLVGNLTAPAVPPHLGVFGQGDLVGTATSGLLSAVVDGVSVAVSLTSAEFSIAQQDKTCVPSATQACRYTVDRTVFKTSGFNLLGTSFASSTIANTVPFETVLGGSGASSLTSPLPQSVQYQVQTSSPISTYYIYPGAMANITVSPAGSGLIAMSGQFAGSIDNHSVAMNLVATANTPLANRPPVASAGPDMTVVGTGDCKAWATLNGSGSYDPDGNIDLIRWYEGYTLVGIGPTPTVRIATSGKHIYTIVVTDKKYSSSRDYVAVTATVSAGCGTYTPPPTPPPILL